MELRQLEALVAVADSSSFTKAAEQLFLTQSAVTRQIAALERETKTRLFDRLGRRVVLTATGSVLDRYAREMLRLNSEASQAVGDVTSGATGKLAVGSSSTAAAYLLPPLLRQFRTERPAIDISVRTGPSGYVAELVANNQVDVGLVMDTPTIDGLRAIKVSEYSIALIVYPEHPLAAKRSSGVEVTLDQLTELPLILMQRGASLRNSADKILGQADPAPTISMELDNVEAIKKMIEARIGVSLLPIMSVKNEIESGTLVALPVASPNPSHQSIVIIHRDDKYISQTMRSFIELAQTRLSVVD